MSWKSLFFKSNLVGSYLFSDINMRVTSSISSSGVIPKVKFVREQRIFAKGSRGPIKKRSTTLLRHLVLYLSSTNIQNTPPISTLLGLYGINVQKFCDDYNKMIKELFFENIPLKVSLRITKDLNFAFKIEKIRLNFLLQCLDTRFLDFRQSLLTTKSSGNRFVRSFYQTTDQDELEYRDFTFMDVWFLLFFCKEFFFKTKSVLDLSDVVFYSYESLMRVFRSNASSFKLYGVYRFRRYNLIVTKNYTN